MKSLSFKIIVAAAVLLVIGGISFGIYKRSTTPGQYDDFATCLGEKGAKFYGAYWCPHCANQKKMFGRSEKKLPYIECAIPGNSQAVVQECKDANIEGYPTWTFEDESRLTGEIALPTLAEKTGCELPNES